MWTLTSGFPDFKKHWGKIEQDLMPGKYTVTIDNNFDVSEFEGEKYIVLSTTNVTT